MPPGGPLTQAVKNAQQVKRKAAASSDSEDSDAVQRELDRKQRQNEAKKALKEKEEVEVATQKLIEKQCAVNASRIQELADKRYEYPVLLSLPFDSCLTVLIFVLQSDELQQPPRSVQPTPTTDPFEIFKTHPTMQTINAHLVPWLIAEFGTEYADFGNNKRATAMIAH